MNMLNEPDYSEVVGQGRTAEIRSWGQGKIVKLFRDFIPEAAIETEYRTSKLAFDAGIPTPEPHGMMKIDGKTGIVYDRIYDPSLLKQIFSAPLLAGRTNGMFAALHARMHQAIAPAGFPRQKEGLARAISATPLLAEQEKAIILRCLASLPEGDRLCHGDYHQDNVLAGKQLAVIDWMNGSRGDPACDVARTTILVSLGSLPEGIPAIGRVIINRLRAMLVRGYLREYRRRTGMRQAEIDAWLLPLYAARLDEHNPPDEERAVLRNIHSLLRKQAKQDR